MAVEKLGIALAQRCTKYAEAMGKTSILFTKQPKITSTVGLRLAPTLQKNATQTARRVKSPEVFSEMIIHYTGKNNIQLAKNLAIRGVETHPADIGLISLKQLYIKDNAQYMQELSRAISIKPSVEGYITRFEQFMEQGKSKEALDDLKKAIECAKKEKYAPEFIAEMESMLGNSGSNVARTLKPLPLTAEQQAFNSQVDDYWKKYQKEINETMEETRTFSMSNVNTTSVETSAKNHLLNSIKQVGKPEDFGLTRGQTLYHGTNYEAKRLIETYGFDLNKCGRYETGKGAYLGFDNIAVHNSYGSDVVEARFIGEKIAKVEPGVYQVVMGDGGTITPLKIRLMSDLNLNFSDPKSIDIAEEIMTKYYHGLLESRGIQGLITTPSFNAGMSYFMVPNPSKYLEIL